MTSTGINRHSSKIYASQSPVLHMFFQYVPLKFIEAEDKRQKKLQTLQKHKFTIIIGNLLGWRQVHWLCVKSVGKYKTKLSFNYAFQKSRKWIELKNFWNRALIKLLNKRNNFFCSFDELQKHQIY